MDIALLLLIEKLNRLFGAEPEITEKGTEYSLRYGNPSGGRPVQVLYSPADDIKVTLNKTPRYYPQDESSIERLLRDAENYITGKTVSLDYTDNHGNESKTDRIAKVSDAEVADVDSLIELSNRISLLNSVDLKYLLVNGGTVNVHFWDTARDFRYRQIGSSLKKI